MIESDNVIFTALNNNVDINKNDNVPLLNHTISNKYEGWRFCKKLYVTEDCDNTIKTESMPLIRLQ